MASGNSVRRDENYTTDDEDFDDRKLPENEHDDFFTIRKMSRLSLESEGHDADVEPSDDDVAAKSISHATLDEDSDKEGSWTSLGISSMPGTPVRGQLGRQLWCKDYASETEFRGVRRGKGRRMRGQRRLEQAWETRKMVAEAVVGCDSPVLVVRSGVGGNGRMVMDLDEVRGCRDLGLELPNDWRVEIPGGIAELAAADTSSGGNSPIATWRISSPGDDPRDVKAKLKMWAQVVAFASASSSPSRLSG